ncbi:MAG: alpha-galactosidase [Lachnospiraceae bacterium]|nr:alpha-galactosidase [Lachnospiraceae bacterium]
MNIEFFEQERIFKLDTPNTTYMLQIADTEGFPVHLYYGRRLRDHILDDPARLKLHPFMPSKNERERCSFLDCTPFEYPNHGLGDYRDDAFSVINPDGHTATSLSYSTHRIYDGKPAIPGLPATFEGNAVQKGDTAVCAVTNITETGSDSTDSQERGCKTLEILCLDEANGLEITLYYSVFDDNDAIVRSVKFKNTGKYNNIKLTKALSTCVELYGAEYDTIFLHGSWARERWMDRQPLGYGKHSVSSCRGESSHQEHPFIAVCERGADEDHGHVYGFNFVYSGNFIAQAERSQFDQVRVLMGIDPVDFSWNLRAGEEFHTPEVISVFSAEGIGTMTRNFHDLYRNHLIRSRYLHRKRPILINNWEATYFDFDTDKLIAIAKQAKEYGIEMLVMDDGWFGHRNDDNSSLGDWYVNENKLKGGLKHLVDEVNAIGLKFGIWMEPEMISPDSDLFREHPDWAIQIPGRKPTLSRAQLVLDLSRKEIRDYVFSQVEKVLKSAHIEYLKWDMNRQLTDLGSSGLDKDSQGELFHRYVLGVYELQERLVSEFPDLLLENCSGGGARFDPGMLYYSPQIWTSDDTDAIERLAIQQGTALIYPLSTMGAHVSDCPNHAVGRVTPFETRGYVALAGTFGYELDVTKIPKADQEMIPKQVAMYHKYNDLVREGDYLRVASYQENHEWDCWEVVSKDKSEALVTLVQVLNHANMKPRVVKLKGLDPDKTYSLRYFDIGTGNETDEELVLGGDVLMYAGINMTGAYNGDFRSRLLHLKEI